MQNYETKYCVFTLENMSKPKLHKPGSCSNQIIEQRGYQWFRPLGEGGTRTNPGEANHHVKNGTWKIGSTGSVGIREAEAGGILSAENNLGRGLAPWRCLSLPRPSLSEHSVSWGHSQDPLSSWVRTHPLVCTIHDCELHCGGTVPLVCVSETSPSPTRTKVLFPLPPDSPEYDITSSKLS